jgi:hypothetical protein
MAESTPAVPGRIFLNYWREAEWTAGWLHDRLVARYGRDQVFKASTPSSRVRTTPRSSSTLLEPAMCCSR